MEPPENKSRVLDEVENWLAGTKQVLADVRNNLGEYSAQDAAEIKAALTRLRDSLPALSRLVAEK